MPADYHTHTPLCLHATGSPVEYARAARDRGLAEIGISDHNPMPEPFDDWRMSLADFPRYLDLVAEARSDVAPYPVRLGLEIDYLEGGEPWIERLAGMADWDYLIGAVHYIAPGWDVDNPKHLSRFAERPVEEIWDLYWKAYTRCGASGLFDLLAHPDLVKKFGHRPSGDLRRWYDPALEAIAASGAAIELSTAGLRKPVGEMYPAPEFLRLARDAGIPIVLSSDAHSPNEVGLDFDRAAALARSCGFAETVRFAGRRRTTEPL